jgi:hypothetical protein
LKLPAARTLGSTDTYQPLAAALYLQKCLRAQVFVIHHSCVRRCVCDTLAVLIGKIDDVAWNI